MSRIERIKKALAKRFPAADVAVLDETSLHAGHRETLRAKNALETHLCITVCDAEFDGAPPLRSVREINKILKHEFALGLHAVKIACNAPGKALPAEKKTP